MPLSLNTRLPWEELAAERRTLSGRIDAGALAQRLGEALARPHPAGTVDYEFHFAPGAIGWVTLRGTLHARLEATCQRCLQAFEMPLEVAVDLELDTGGSTLDARGGTRTGAVEQGDAAELPTLAAVIEEELLLALPFLPRHAHGGCSAASGAVEAAGDAAGVSRRPFAGLREALERARKGDSH